MRLKITCLALLASVAACLGTAAVASAASSPTATATKATSVSNTSAVIHATITPNGDKTTYYFSYGGTSALGTSAPVHTLAAGSKATAVSYTVSQLESGSTYYFDLTAVNAAGGTVTKTLHFKTTGVTPASATTGTATVVNSNSVTLTGVVTTQNASTQYYFVYGPTTAYGSQTAAQTATASTSPTGVSYTLSGLAPGTTFYYALVAVNGPGNTSVGLPSSIETFPDPVPTPRVVQQTTPVHPKRGPYVFTTSGRIEYTNKTSPVYACTGTATASFYYDKKLVHRLEMPVGAACQFYGKSEFRTLPVKGLKSEKLTVYIKFSGNHYFKGVILKPETVTLG